MNCWILSVLMWKQYVVKKRRFILTAVEILSTIFFFVLLFLFRNEIKPIPKHATRSDLSTLVQPEAIPLTIVSKPSTVYYGPDSGNINLLMEKVRSSLKKTSRRSISFVPFINVSEVLKQTKQMAYDDAIVVFQNTSDNTWPEKLNYTIRMKNAFVTHDYDPKTSYRIAHSAFGSIYEPFMSLQWAIDTSYIETLTGKEVQQEVTLQEFPYLNRSGQSPVEMVCGLVGVLCFFSLVLVFVNLVSRLLEERCSGILELMKMVGVYSTQLALSYFIILMVPGLVFSIGGVIFLTASSNPLLTNTNGFLLFLTFLLFYLTIVSMAFVCSYLTTSTRYAVTLAVLVYFVLWLPAYHIQDVQMSYGLRLITGLLPHQPLNWVLKEIEHLEKYGQGLTFSSMAKSHSEYSASTLVAYLFMLIQMAIFFAFNWYLYQVRPGEYGQALPWNFLFQKHYWGKNDVEPIPEMEELEQYNPDSAYFQPSPPDHEVGISIRKVCKRYTNSFALLDVSLNAHRGEITMLLGHNGAGKTTLMSIITGMLSATSGQVYVDGAEMAPSERPARSRLGFCPQHNIFFPDLTVVEHVMFFTKLKTGCSLADAQKQSEDLLHKLGIYDKRNNKSGELSGGMKRRLQLACALAGDADVLVLDEPTSGLDVETRRELWDLLLSLRGSRSVLLSTHFMEEADALGDRVAVLHAGTLRCYATPLYLKKAVGTGYRLSFTTIGPPKEPAITAVMRTHVAEALLKDSTLNSLTYSLPAASSEKFPVLFSSLEEKRTDLGIDSIGVGASTLEEVFLRMCSDVPTAYLQEDETDGGGVNTERKLPVLSGLPLYRRQLFALLKRQYNYIMSRKIAFLIMEVALPLTVILLTLQMYGATANDPEWKSVALGLDLNAYDGFGEQHVLYDVSGHDDDAMRVFIDRYPRVQFDRAMDINGMMLRISKENGIEYNKYLLGLELNDTQAKVLYTTTVRHAAPVALNMLSNLIARKLLPLATEPTIVTNNHPLETEGQAEATVEAKNLTSAILCVVTIGFVVLSTAMQGASLASRERVRAARGIYITIS